MSPRVIQTLEVRTRREWRKWLARHHDPDSEIWLIFYKRHTGVASLTCDDARYARKFTPRKADSRWSTTNRRRYADLKSRGLLARSLV
jgi:uncharacterized protein YdeI (YjbR/CyaY-like superfamily)